MDCVCPDTWDCPDCSYPCDGCLADREEMCGRCGKGPKAGAAGLCQACNDEADREAHADYMRQIRDWHNDMGV